MGEDLTRAATDARMESALPDKPNYRFCLLIMLLYMIDGIDMQLLGVTVDALAHDWHLPLSAFGTAMAAGHAGAATGAMVGGILGDRLGRRPVVIGGTLLFSLLSFAMVLAGAPWQLALLRFVAGLGLGGCLPPALALLTENMPGRYRGLSVSLVMLCTPFGIALAGFFAMLLLPLGGWHAVFLLGGFLPLMLTVLLFFMLRESPSFVPGRSERQVQSEGRQGTLGRLLLGEERRKVLSLLGIFFTCYFAMSMVLSWLPALMASAEVGSGVASVALSVWSLAGMPGVIVAGVIMTRWSIRATVGLFMAGAVAALVTLIAALPGHGAASMILPFFALLALGGFMLNGSITAIYAYATEIFPSDIRSSAIGLAATTGRLGAISGAFAGANLLEFAGPVGFFAAIATMVGIALLLYANDVRACRRRAAVQPG